MKKWLTVVLSMALMSAMLIGCGSKPAQEGGLSGELNLYTWDGMFPQEVLDNFEAETGVKINYSNFDYDEDMLAKLEETKGGDYDLVIADDYIIELVIQEGLAQKLDKNQISNFSNVNPIYQGYFYDLSDEYTIPVGAGIPLIVYDKEATGFEITSYEDLWNEKLENNLAIVGNYRVIDGITLKTMGESFNTEDLDTISKAGERLVELAPNIRLISDSNTQDYIVSGEASAALLYTSQVTQALMARPELSVAYPKEGLGFGIMAGFIPSEAPNAAAAHAFLDYILQPENGAKCAEYLGYYCTNKAAEEFISEEMKPMITLPDDVGKGEIIQNVSQEAEDLHSESWKKFQEACN